MDIRRLVFEVFDVQVADTWASNFTARQKEVISRRKGKLLARKRADDTIVERCSEFCAKLTSFWHTTTYWRTIISTTMRLV